MMQVSFYERARIWGLAGWRNRAVSFKAVVYALIGVVNTAIDYAVFLTAHAVLGLPLVAANALSWIVAVRFLYVEFDHYICRRNRAQAALVGIFHLRGVRYRRMARQYYRARDRGRSPAFTGVVGKAASRHGELHRELFIVTLCGIPRAPQFASDHLTRCPPPLPAAFGRSRNWTRIVAEFHGSRLFVRPHRLSPCAHTIP